MIQLSLMEMHYCNYWFKVPEKFGQLATMVSNLLRKVKVIHFVTESYHANSIKGLEHSSRRRSLDQIIVGPLTRMFIDFSNFMHNDDNKKLAEQWNKSEYSVLFKDRWLYFMCEKKCYLLKSFEKTIQVSEINLLESSQEEADTR